MLKNLPLLLLMFLAFAATAQKKKKPEEVFYALDKNMEGTTLENATYLIHSVKESDTSWKFDTYNIYGPMISSERYKDAKGTILHGYVTYFNKNGTRDSTGSYNNNLRDGDFYYFNDTGRVFLEKRFANGVLVETIDKIKKDSIDAAIAAAKKDTAEVVEVESDFKGGVNAWIKYLNKNLVYPDRALKQNIKGTVVVAFIVDEGGHVYGQDIVKSVEYSLDQEALRMIDESPTWLPASQNGKLVKSFKLQPLTFRF